MKASIFYRGFSIKFNYMNTRDTIILSNRIELPGLLYNETSLEEKFQNRTLRPILKAQNDLLIQVFINYAFKQKNVFFELMPDKKMEYIENTILRDIKFRNSLKGIIIGWFTLDEFADYIQLSSNLNKRMMAMITERLKSQIQILQKPS